MIDIENEVYTKICDDLEARFINISLSGIYTPTPPEFPHVSVVMIDNAAYMGTMDGSGNENHAIVTFEIDIYSNKRIGAKIECKAILEAIDTRLNRLGFTRMMATPTPNTNDATLYRITARYRAVVSADTHLTHRR